MDDAVSTLVLGIDSGLDGAFAWYYGGRIVHHVLTRTLVDNGRIDMRQLEVERLKATGTMDATLARWVAYLEEPFNNAISGGASTAGYTDQCKRWGRLQGWLESWGYEVRGVQAKAWQRELLDLARFEVRTEVKCKPKPLPDVVIKALRHGVSYRAHFKGDMTAVAYDEYRQGALTALAAMTGRPTVTATRTVISHDTKAASLAYVREHYPALNLIPPRAKKEHDGLADAVCIAVWGSRQIKETP